jgi:hypothetical protein
MFSKGAIDEDEALLKKPRSAAQCIGWMGSLVLLINTIVGPGIVALPWMYATAGCLATTVGIALASVVALQAMYAMIEATREMPGNSALTRPLAFGDPVAEHIGSRVAKVARSAFYVAIVLNTIATIAPAAAAIDEICAFVTGHAYAFVCSGSQAGTFLAWTNDCADCIEPFYSGESPVPVADYVLSLGYVLLVALCLPFCFGGVCDQMALQYASFGVLVAAVAIYAVYATVGVVERGAADVPVVLAWTAIVRLPGTLVFNVCTYTVLATAWLSEKASGVPPEGVARTASVASALVFIVFGLTLALAFGTDVTLDVGEFLAERDRPLYVRVATYVFSLGVLISGIPVNMIMMRDDLRAAGAGRRTADFYALCVPWLLSWLAYESAAFGALVDLTGLLVVAPLALLAPLLVYMALEAPPPSGFFSVVAWWCVALDEPVCAPAWDLPRGRRSRRGSAAWLALLVAVFIMAAAVGGVAKYV